MAETHLIRNGAMPKKPPTADMSATPHVQTSGPLPLVSVVMGPGGAALQSEQNAQARPGVFVMPLRGQRPGNPAGGARPAPPGIRSVVVMPLPDAKPAVPASLDADQLLLCRHLVTVHLGEQNAQGGTPANIGLAESTIDAIDKTLAELTAAAAVKPTNGNGTAPRRVTVGQRSQLAGSMSPRRTGPAARAPEPIMSEIDADPGDGDDVIDVPDAG